MDRRELGRTGLEVTPLGLGGAEIGLRNVEQPAATRLLNAVLDMGVNVIDTAACYADSELKIGAGVSSRRDQFVLVTKCGDAVDDISAGEWTAELIRQSIDRSLRRLRTDHVDVLLLHSCRPEVLARQELLDALLEAQEAGKARFLGYSGDNDGARAAAGMSIFSVLETSLNICDQQVLDGWLPPARGAGMGVIAKRPLANACWRGPENLGEFYSDYAAPYVRRLEAMGLTPEGVGFDGPWAELALRFACFQSGVSTAITGSTDAAHLRANIEAVEKGPLDAEVVANIRGAWKDHHAGDWVGQT